MGIRGFVRRVFDRKFTEFFCCLAVVIVGFNILNYYQGPFLTPTFRPECVFCEPYDVVYTWVNGSDPEFIQQAQKIDPQFDPSRFDDKNELKYSLRSIEKYAPWVRHIFIVTNGQIPHWLNLECNKVTVIPHHQLVDDPNILPTFSSPVIETFLHRIPNLSKRFLYLNDDIFLGSPLFPEDLFTYSKGVKIYTAWTVPDCAPDCPWVYIGDGSCDQNCNIEDCQFDGNDCIHDGNTNSEETTNTNIVEAATNQAIHNKTVATKVYSRKIRSFDEVIRGKNVTDVTKIQTLVNIFNEEQKKLSKSQRIRKVDNIENVSSPPKVKSSTDVYSQSLIHTNKIFNLVYGFKSRKVLAHVGFLLDKDIVENMLTKFRKEFSITKTHRFRSKNDMQFAFAYYHYLMSEKRNASLDEIFNRFDTDKSSTWSDREIRTLLTKLYPLPLDWAVVKYFDEVITNCSRHFIEKNNGDKVEHTTLVYERYEDSSIPTVTKSLVMNCPPLIEVLHNSFAQHGIHLYNINTKTTSYSNFIMLTSNISEVVDSLDELRQNMKKFNCINDNLEPQFIEENELIRNLLEDFYLSFFPQQSKFELPAQYRNRFDYIDDYREWKRNKLETLIFAGVFGTILTVIGLKYFCRHKAKYARKFIPNKFCDI